MFLDYNKIIFPELEFSISDNDWEAILNFAKKREAADSEYMKEKRRVSPEKFCDDVAKGAKGEYVVNSYLNSFKTIRCSLPDLNLYDTIKKNWKADLTVVDNTKFKLCHVKSCYISDIPTSWIFNIANDKSEGGQDFLFNLKDDDCENLIALVTIAKNSKKGIIKCFGLWKYFKPFLKDPYKPDLIGIKKAIYFNDLKE